MLLSVLSSNSNLHDIHWSPAARRYCRGKCPHRTDSTQGRSCSWYPLRPYCACAVSPSTRGTPSNFTLAGTPDSGDPIRPWRIRPCSVRLAPLTHLLHMSLTRDRSADEVTFRKCAVRRTTTTPPCQLLPDDMSNATSTGNLHV
jgi:hypothetical protein